MRPEIFDAYERRFAAARAEKELLRPWVEADRETIREQTKRMLRWDEALIPEVSEMEVISQTDCGSCSVLEYRYQTWVHCYGAATLYLPVTDGPHPLVFVCCGHGKRGRQSEHYAAMGKRLSQLGMAALVMDNLGQGDRNLYPDFKNRGHWQAVAPFACGLSLQGLIVMETVAMIRHMRKDSRFDPARFAACGNSGGGTLTMFLAALAPELSVLASSGYPSEMQYVFAKEKVHCACNLLPGALHGPDMWQIYSLFAPKPLLLSGGELDHLFAPETVKRNGRKVKDVYEKLSALESVRVEQTASGHSWKVEDINLISAFLSEQLLGITPEAIAQFPEQCTTSVPMPQDAVDAEVLAQQLTGISVPGDILLHTVYPPVFEGNVIDTTLFDPDTVRIWAQYECVLHK